ncbi:hypothetical protein D4764_0100880 [Takifugu flavidus]|uniref:Sodium channel subunit beta-4 n=1 Tax=Takifugu flavidus TaxID=433684 RepID=A0A5C6MIE3_9TELE|nr:hypothetical protein D4764_0100880 [Takifugu flavidus]
MPPGRLPGEVFRACPSGRRPPGRPRTRWRDYVSRLAAAPATRPQISVKEDDNTLTVFIVSVLGGVIGLVIIVMVIKAVVLHFLRKGNEKNKECLVSTSGNDNTENGLSGAKADNKDTPKA